MIICEVKQGCRNFVFKAPCKIEKGIWVMCDTMYGEHPGEVVRCFEADPKSELYKAYIEAMGTYEPLKEVTGFFIPLKWLTAAAKESRLYKR